MKHVTSLLIIICLTSCVSKKHLVQNGQVESEATLNSIESNKSTSVINLIDTQEDSTFMEWETVTRKYDTSVPPDSLGRHPLKEEAITHAKKKSHSSASVTKKVAAITGNKSVSNMTTKGTEKLSTKTHDSVSVAGGNWIILLWLFLAFAAILFLYFFVIKKWLK